VVLGLNGGKEFEGHGGLSAVRAPLRQRSEPSQTRDRALGKALQPVQFARRSCDLRSFQVGFN
jgi:hypothetical protein